MNKMETLTVDFIVLVVYGRECWLRMMLNEQRTVSFILEESIGKEENDHEYRVCLCSILLKMDGMFLIGS